MVSDLTSAAAVLQVLLALRDVLPASARNLQALNQLDTSKIKARTG